LWDGVNDLVNIYSAAFAAAFNSAEGSLSIWIKVYNNGVWTDGTARFAIKMWADANNLVHIAKTTLNKLQSAYAAAGVVEARDETTVLTSWINQTVTWSKSGEKFIYYLNGMLVETDTTLGIWAGSLASNTSVIGCGNSAVPANVWYGYLAHAAIFDRVLTAGEIATTYALRNI
jgi:hypothetical protein